MLIALLAQHRVEQVAVSIYRLVEITPAPADLHIRLVQVPGETSIASTARSENLTDQRRKMELSDPDGLVTELKSSFKEELSNVPETELVSKSPEWRSRRRRLEITDR